MKFFSLFVFCFLLASVVQAQLLLPDSLLRPDSLGIYHPVEIPTPKKERRWWVVPYPVVAYTPETKWVGGVYVGAVARLKGADKPSSGTLQAMYSERQQVILALRPEVFVASWRGMFEAKYLRWPDTFYGIGNATDEARQEDYAVRVASLETALSREVRPHFYLGLRHYFEATKLTEVQPGGVLAAGTIAGSRPGHASGLFATAAWDTRAHLFAPRTGSYYQGWAGLFRAGLGSDFTYNRYGLDLRHYWTLGGTHSLALQGYGSFTAGTPPFRQLSKLGGDVRMRGYYEGRYRDRQYVMTQLEYRFPLWRGFRGALFAGAGDVTDELAHFQSSEFKHALGGGLRYVLIPKEQISLRLDVGYGAGSDAFYIGVNEAF